MDKILLTAFLTALAGFITAALSIVKLVNEKESKTTEYRQAWTESVRTAMAELIAKINAKASTMVSAKKNILNYFALHEGREGKDELRTKNLIELQRVLVESGYEKSNSLTSEIYQAYASVRLHFKPDDIGFNRVEQKFEWCMAKFEELKAEQGDEKIGAIKEQIHSAANDMTAFSRSILKTEWETVKLGEPAYKETKKWSIRACILMFFLLVTIGVHAAISYSKKSASEVAVVPVANLKP